MSANKHCNDRSQVTCLLKLAQTNGLTAIKHLHKHEQGPLIQVTTASVKVLPVSFKTSRDRADEVRVTGVQLQRMTHVNPLDTDRIRT